MSYNKYGNRQVEEDGYRFDSRAEYRRYRELKLMEKAGAIDDLTLHPSWELIVNGEKIGRYTADFLYCDPDKGLVVEDTKGVRTRDYILRKKLMKAILGIEITEVTS